MKVVTSSLGTFHMFEQAQQLHRHGLLDLFIAGPPKSYATRRGLPAGKYRAAADIFSVSYATSRYLGKFSGAKAALTRFSHNAFSKRLPGKIPADTDIFIGMSSYCEEGLAYANCRNIVTVVDHASLHERFEKEQLLMEKETFGFRHVGNSTNEWLIEKQEREFQSANHVMAASNVAKTTMIKAGVDPNKIVVNSLGVALENFYWRRKEDDIFRIAYCGQVKPGKGVHYLLNAFEQLKLKNAELLIIGSLGGVQEDPYFERYLKERTGTNVRFTGAVNAQRVSELLSQSSIFVMPSLADGFGMVVTQAMACGLPVIVSDHTGASELISDGENGFVIPARDTDLLHHRIAQLAADPIRASEMGRNAIQTVEQGFTWDDYGDRLAEIMRKLA